MVFTDDDEDQIMFDLYDGLDTFAQKADEEDKQQDDPSKSITVITDVNASENNILYGNEANELDETGGTYTEDHTSAGIADQDDDDDDDDDGLVFLVEEEDEATTVPETSIKETRPTGKRKPGGWATRYKKRERIVYIGAPSSESQAMASTEPKKECFCLVSGIPWWMDAHEFNSSMETLGGVVAFSKIWSDPLNGVSLGVGLVEFVDGDSGTILSKAKSQFIATELPDDVFEVIKESPLYREGVFKNEMLNRIVAHLGISLRRTPAASVTSDHFHEIEFEVRQQEMIQNGEFEATMKVFPWLNLSVLKLMGYAKRNEQSDMDNTYNIENHLEAYKQSKSINQNYFNMMMPQLMMANYMQHASKETSETGKSPFPFKSKTPSQQDKSSSRQKSVADNNKERNEQEQMTNEKERSSRSTSHRKEEGSRRRTSESPHARRHRTSSRSSNRSRSRHKDNGRSRDWR